MQYRLHAVLVHHAFGSRGNSGHYVLMRRVKTTDDSSQDMGQICLDQAQSLRLQTSNTEHTGRSDECSCSGHKCKQGHKDVQALGNEFVAAEASRLECKGMCCPNPAPLKEEASAVWLRISDADCRQVSVQDVVRAEATMLLYERVD